MLPAPRPRHPSRRRRAVRPSPWQWPRSAGRWPRFRFRVRSGFSDRTGPPAPSSCRRDPSWNGPIFEWSIASSPNVTFSMTMSRTGSSKVILIAHSPSISSSIFPSYRPGVPATGSGRIGLTLWASGMVDMSALTLNAAPSTGSWLFFPMTSNVQWKTSFSSVGLHSTFTIGRSPAASAMAGTSASRPAINGSRMERIIGLPHLRRSHSASPPVGVRCRGTRARAPRRRAGAAIRPPG